jgi:hypothetical protein
MSELNWSFTESKSPWQGIPTPCKNVDMRPATETFACPVATANSSRKPAGGRRYCKWFSILLKPVIFAVHKRLKNASEPPSKSLGI